MGVILQKNKEITTLANTKRADRDTVHIVRDDIFRQGAKKLKS